MDRKEKSFENFRHGKYKFSDSEQKEYIDMCWDTIDYINKTKGTSKYTHSSRFWSALLMLVRHKEFDALKWKRNLINMIERFSLRGSQDDYLRLFIEVYNWRNNNRIRIDADE